VSVVSYPILVHLSVLFDSTNLRGLALGIICLLTHLPLIQKNSMWWFSLLSFVGLIVAALFTGKGVWLLYLTPVALISLFLVYFGMSLANNSVPVVTRYAIAIRGSISDEMLRYTRSVTVAWVFLFVFMLILSVVLPFTASDAAWSWVTNVGNYALMGAFFVVEYLIRRWRFPEHDHPPFWQYIFEIARRSRPGQNP